MKSNDVHMIHGIIQVVYRMLSHVQNAQAVYMLREWIEASYGTDSAVIPFVLWFL